MDNNVIPDLLKNAGDTMENDLISKLLLLGNTPSQKSLIEIDQIEEAKHKKARGSVGAELFAYNDQGTVGLAYRNLAKRRRESYIREY